MGVTFVTALYLPSTPIYRKLDAYISHFEELASTNIPIILHLDSRLVELGNHLCKKYSNIQHCIYGILDTSYVPTDVILPYFRNKEKDTVDYLCIQLSKLKLMKDSEQLVKTTHMAWIDFGIFHMFKEKELCRLWLNKIAFSSFKADKILSPSSYDMEYLKSLNHSFNSLHSVYWIHCGSLLLGPKDKFGPAYEAQMKAVRAHLPQLTWEVNYWVMIDEHFIRYSAIHSDIILENVCQYLN